MVKSDDYRLYLEERFSEQGNSLKEIKDGIADINSHLKQLNGKIIEHEKYIVYANGVIETRRKQTENIEKKIDELEEEIKRHPVTCPNFSEIKSIKDDLEEYRIIKKYPKLIVILFAVLTAGAIVGFINTASGLRKLTNRVDIINTPVTTRSGTIEWWPSGVVIDSLKKNDK